jgi:sugar (pentulose or hexulose) kinase
MSKQLTGDEIVAIDAGTQGLSALLWCPQRKQWLGVGEADYASDYIEGLPDGRLEQYASWWTDAMVQAMAKLRQSLRDQGFGEIESVAGIGVTGHMHCMVRRDADGAKPFGCDMWNDPRGVAESAELTALFGEHMPSRWTACHILARMRSEPDQWSQATGVTVTSGSLLHDLTGAWAIGPGDATGMFGNLDAGGQIDREKLRKLDAATGNRFTPLEQLVPKVIPAGQVAGRLNARGSELLGGLPQGIPVAPPEGDQQTTLIAAAAGELELALSAGTSFAGNLPCRAKVLAESETINVLETPDRLTMLMVCARNGTVGFAQYVQGLAEMTGRSFSQVADELTDLARQTPADCHGALLMGFFQGENVTELPHARAQLKDASIDLLANPGVMARLLLEAPCLTMRYGIEQLRPRIGDLKAVVLTGGALKSKGGFAPQLFANVLGVPVTGNIGDEEGTAKGAGILGAYMVATQAGADVGSLAEFAKTQTVSQSTTWQPQPELAPVYEDRYKRFEREVRLMQDR